MQINLDFQIYFGKVIKSILISTNGIKFKDYPKFHFRIKSI